VGGRFEGECWLRMFVCVCACVYVCVCWSVAWLVVYYRWRIVSEQ
jgi:hypothetical protein